MTNPQERKEYGRFFSSDRPIQSQAEDRLGRWPFARALAEAISAWRQRDSLVIALYGPWGIGKSSIKNLALDAIKDKSAKVLTAQFNPWVFANRDQLLEAFFDQVGIALGEGPVASQKQRSKLLRKWQRYAAYLTVGRTAAELVRKPIGLTLMAAAGLSLAGRLSDLPAFGYWIDLFLIVGSALLLGSSTIANAITDWLKIGTEVGRKTLEEVKEDLGKALEELDLPVLVILDDLDRLTPAETLEMLQIVKVNADLPNLVFLLMCDREVVSSHLESVLKTSGEQFLEKIVQVAFDVPVVERRRMLRALTDALDELLANDKAVASNFDQVRWGNVFVDGLDQYFKNLRDVNRFLSTLAFHVNVLRGTVAFEVNFIDLIALEVLRVFEPKIYHAIAREKSLLTGRFQTGRRDDADKARIVGLLDHVGLERRKRVTDILTVLFPPAEWAFGGSNYDSGWGETWERELRVCSPDIFDRYFHFALPEGDISQDVLAGIVADSSDRQALVERFLGLLQAGDLEATLDRLEAYKTKIPVEALEPFATALLDISDGISTESAGMFAISPMMHLIRIVHWSLMTEKDKEKRQEILLVALKNTIGLAGPVYVVGTEDKAADKDKGDDTRAFTNEGLEQAQALCVRKFRDAAVDGRLKDSPAMLGILYRWRDWEGPDGPRQFSEALASTPEGAVRLVDLFLQRALSSGLGDKVSRVNWSIKPSAIEEFASLDQIELSLKNVDQATLTERQRIALETFQKAMSRRKAGKPEKDGFFDRNED